MAEFSNQFPSPADEVDSPHDERVTDAETPIDPARVQQFVDELHNQQNLAAGILAGSVAAVFGALAWAVITVATNYQIGYMAVGIGFLVGLAVRKFGKGMTTPFGVTGAMLAFAGCLVGNLLTYSIILAKGQNVPLSDVLLTLAARPMLAVELLQETFSGMDLLFYGIATYEGYKLSFRQISPAEATAALQPEA
jgi:hypothetical protein